MWFPDVWFATAYASSVDESVSVDAESYFQGK